MLCRWMEHISEALYFLTESCDMPSPKCMKIALTANQIREMFACDGICSEVAQCFLLEGTIHSQSPSLSKGRAERDSASVVWPCCGERCSRLSTSPEPAGVTARRNIGPTRR